MPRQTGGQDELSKGLKAARLAAGLTSTYAAADRTGYTQPRISRLESGKTLQSPEVVRELCEFYGTKRAERTRLVALAETMRARSRRVVISRRPSTMARIRDIQGQSHLVRGFASIGLPGPLQTPDYLLNLMSARGGRTPSAIAATQERLQSHELMDDPTSARRWEYIIAEGALGWAFGDGAVMAAQMEKLEAATYRRNLTLGVVPFGAWDPTLTLPLNGWEMYDERLVMVGTVSMTADLTQPADIATYLSMFQKLAGIAVYGEQARSVLGAAGERYRRSSP